jgi:hypothetical protein
MVIGFCEHDNEPSDSIKGGEFNFSRRTLLYELVRTDILQMMFYFR